MLSWQTLTIVTAPSSSFKRYRLSGACSLASYRILRTAATLTVPGFPPGLRAISTEPLESRNDGVKLTQSDTDDLVPRIKNEEEEEEPGISRIQVSRQKYIPVSKAELLDAIVSRLFDSRDEDAHLFRLLSSYVFFFFLYIYI